MSSIVIIFMFLLFERKLMAIGFYESGKFLVIAKKKYVYKFIHMLLRILDIGHLLKQVNCKVV